MLKVKKLTSFIILLLLFLYIITGFAFNNKINISDFTVVCQRGSINEIKSYIKQGIDLNKKDEYGLSPLMYASMSNQNEEVIQLLINSGANVNDISSQYIYGISNYTPLMFAAKFNKNEKIIETLIKNNAKINFKNYSGDTALIIAAGYNQNKNVIETLLKNGANLYDQNKSGITPLINSILFNKNKEVVKFLLNKTNKNKIFTYCIEGNYLKLKNLLKIDKNINLMLDDFFSPLMFCIKFTNNEKIIELLLKNGAIINLQNKYGDTPLITATKYTNNKNIFEILLKYNPDISIENQYHETAIISAIINNKNKDILNLLLNYNYKKNKLFDKYKILYKACKYSNYDAFVSIFKYINNFELNNNQINNLYNCLFDNILFHSNSKLINT